MPAAKAPRSAATTPKGSPAPPAVADGDTPAKPTATKPAATKPAATKPAAKRPAPKKPTGPVSPWSGFYRLAQPERLDMLAKVAKLTKSETQVLAAGGLDAGLAQRLVENQVGSFALPLGVAVGFVVDGKTPIVPMAVEESSVIAAASHGAKMVALGGGFHTRVDDPIMLGQVEVRAVRKPRDAVRVVRQNARAWRDWLNGTIPSMTHRGGGVRAVEAHLLGKDRLVVHLHVDCRDAMGANLVNSLCETIAPALMQALDAAGTGGRIGLRILSNLSTERLARAMFRIPVAAVGGPGVAKAIVEANQFALLDPYRAATHNKGILNGIDPVAIATGNDWRAVEAGAHAYAARTGMYRALTSYSVVQGHLHGALELPLAVGTIGGVTRLHPVAQVALKLLGNPDAKTLAGTMAAVGLAQNLSALKALSTTGIQSGHMGLHAQNLALQAGLTGAEADRIAKRMVDEGRVNATRARDLATQA